MRALFSKLPLRVSAPIVLSLPVLTAVAVLSLIAFWLARSAANKLANDQLVEIHRRIDQQLSDLLKTPARINRINAQMVEDGRLDLVDLRTWRQFLYGQAIGAMRAGSNDVGEIRRVLNSFLQFLEQDDSDSVIVAATNLEDLLDAALFRRFDDVIRYRLPKQQELHDLIANRLAAFKLSGVERKELAVQAVGLSHAEMCRACDEAAKMAVLDDRRTIAAPDLQRSIQLRQERRRVPK